MKTFKWTVPDPNEAPRKEDLQIKIAEIEKVISVGPFIFHISFTLLWFLGLLGIFAKSVGWSPSEWWQTLILFLVSFGITHVIYRERVWRKSDALDKLKQIEQVTSANRLNGGD